MNLTHKLPRLADLPDFEFVFITSPTPALRAKAADMMSIARDNAINALGCACPPWIDCAHGDRQKVDLWAMRAKKISLANDDALMVVLSAPIGDNPFLVVDRLVLGDDGVCRP